jgi:hypothetical protein
MRSDLEKEIEKLKEQGHSEEEIDETVHMLRSIMEPFADAAWGQHPVQLATNEKKKKSLCPPASYARLEETENGQNE